MESSKKWLDNTSRKDFANFSSEEAVGWIVQKLNLVESDIVEVICNYYSPKRASHFRQILLNNSITSFGAKLKILRNIQGFDKKVLEQLSKMSSIRNGFAHTVPLFTTEIVVPKMSKTPSSVESFDVLLTMDSSGKIKQKKFVEYLCEFRDLYNSVRDYTTKATLLSFDGE